MTRQGAVDHPRKARYASLAQALRAEILADNLSLVAAALAYRAIFGLLPALAAAAAIWGQVADFEALKQSADSAGSLLPEGTPKLLEQFVTGVPKGFGGGLGLALSLGLVVVTAYKAASTLLSALNIVYERAEARSWLWRAVVALLIGLSGIVLLFASLVTLSVPALLAGGAHQEIGHWLVWARWPALAALFTAALGLLFRFGPSRNPPSDYWVGWSALAAAALWIAASVGLSLYVANVASFGRLYGSLGGVAVVLLWFYVSAYAILVGAEIDAYLASRAD